MGMRGFDKPSLETHLESSGFMHSSIFFELGIYALVYILLSTFLILLSSQVP
jgi:hypothetical protein